MYRWPCIVALLAGCDVVFGLEEKPFVSTESTRNDEDGDGRVDASDPCPHIAGDLGEDPDGDDIGDECDPDSTRAHDRYFFGFAEDSDLRRVSTIGRVIPDPAEPGAVVIGGLGSARSGLVLDVATDTARIELDAVFVDLLGVLDAGQYTEVELYAVHRMFDVDDQERGDVCVAGRQPGFVPPNYVERKEDARQLDDVRFHGLLQDMPFRFVLDRDPTSLLCSLQIATDVHETPTLPATTPRSGKVIVATEHLEMRVRWLWIVVPRP